MKKINKAQQILLVIISFTLLSASYVNAASYQPLANAPTYQIGNAQQAARKVKGKYGGKVLKVQRVKVNGNPGYKVKVLKDNGHVISVNVDAKTGQVSGN